MGVGVDLVGAMLDLAFARPVRIRAPGKAGVRAHRLMIAILGAAQEKRPRLAVLREVCAALRHRGDCKNSVEELTPLRGDPIAALPLSPPQFHARLAAGEQTPAIVGQ
jgi:hypothetical protein